MPTLTTQPFDIYEKSTAEFSWDFQDNDGNAVNSAALLSVALTLYDTGTNQIINNRESQDILGMGNGGANNVSIMNSGSATWYMQPEDNPIIAAQTYEDHVALVEWSWNPGDGHGVRQGKDRHCFRIIDLNYVS